MSRHPDNSTPGPPAATVTGVVASRSREGRGTEGDLRADEHALMWLLDLVSPMLPDPHGRVRHYGVLPRPEAPRYLIPLDSAKASAAFLVRPGNVRSLTQRALRQLLRPALRFGVVPLFRRKVDVPDGLPGTPSLIQWLEEELGLDDLLMSVAIGPPRPNRKPILQVMTSAGRTVCFGKIAVDEHTARLVRNESAFLTDHKPEGFVVPKLLAHDVWKGNEIALLSVLPLDQHHHAARALELTPAIVLEIARLMPLCESDVLASPWWAAVVERSAGHASVRSARHLRACVEDLRCQLDGVRWTFGAWHGDLTPWNAEWVDGRLHIWDWERTGGPVPLGFDVVHAEFQVAHLRAGLPVSEASEEVITVQGPLLERLGIPRSECRRLVNCYRLELSLRLLDAARYGPIGGLEPLVNQLLSAATGRPAT